MKHCSLLFLVVLLFACSKQAEQTATINGVWVEQSLRLDTLDFTTGDVFGARNDVKTVVFRSKPFVDSSISTIYPINNSTFYSYYFQSDSLHLLNFLSSSMLFRSYKFQITTNQQTFIVTKFFTRNTLPTTLTFEKIK